MSVNILRMARKSRSIYNTYFWAKIGGQNCTIHKNFLINKTVWMNSENFYLLRLKLRCNEFVFQSMMQTNNKQSEE